MPHRYAVSLSLSAATPAFLIAGAQGLTVTAAAIFTTATSTNCAVQRANSVVGGSTVPILGLDDPVPTPLASAVSSPTSWTTVGHISESDFPAAVVGHDLLAESGPIVVAPGNALFFQLSGPSSPAASLNVYFEE